MKKKYFLLVAILIMCVGFAAISTTLIINGNARVSENANDFSVIFTAASLDGTDVYDQVISQDKKTITFETSELKALNQTSVLTYEVTNNSANYDAEVTVNCKVKDDAEAKYTSIKNELEGNATKVLAKESVNGTLTVTLNKTATEEVKEEYVCELTFNAVERDTLGENIPDPESFATDSWETIQKAVQTGNTSKYNVGDTKEVDLGDLGTHTVRITNMSECTNGETSETACGFIVEFADIIENHYYNNSNSTIYGTNVGGWKDSEMRTYVNNAIYNALPNDLQNIIITTKVISGHGSTSGETNFETQDKLYLLSSEEIYGDFASSSNARYDTSVGTSKQLDYYKNQEVTVNNYQSAIKKNAINAENWFLRSCSYNNNYDFFIVGKVGNWSSHFSISSLGISSAFRIG